MAEHAIRLPDIGEGIAEAEVVHWHVAAGDVLTEDQPFVDVMTDKATVELPSPVTGTVLRLAADVGEFVAVGAPLIWVDLSDEASAKPVQNSTTGEVASADTAGPEAPTPRPVAGVQPELPTALSTGPRSSGRPLAAPAVRRRAAALGIDLLHVPGSGPDGHVMHADLDAYLISGRGLSATPADRVADDAERVEITGLRRNIARRMQEAHRIPHFSYVESVDVGEVQRLRARLNDQASADQPRLTVLPFLMRAVILAVADHPEVNARYDAGAGVLERFTAVHLGIATQTPGGLMVPVVRHAETGDLWQHAAEVRRLADAASARTITPAELTGSTITITSLGALGGISSTPIINAPEVAIIGVNRIVEQPVIEAGGMRHRPLMNLSSSFDHRVVDGWDAARFIHRVKDLLQNPATLFIDEPHRPIAEAPGGSPRTA